MGILSVAIGVAFPVFALIKNSKARGGQGADGGLILILFVWAAFFISAGVVMITHPEIERELMSDPSKYTVW